jgi:NAD+ synthase (glutamine-hydrolysing)
MRSSSGVGAAPLVRVATCSLNQWALDFDGNLERVERSIRTAKAAGARYRLGPELELCGYGCEDHFLEADTLLHSDESLATLLSGDATHGILCDIGAPVMHHGVRYNCRVFCLDGKILLIRPKLFMADDGNYRESRHFTSWKRPNVVQPHLLSAPLREATGQEEVPFGHGAVQTQDSMIACEACEELWTPHSPHIEQSLAGVEITGNGSGSHHQLRKLDVRVSYMTAATAKCGGIYLYANQQGCDGGRLYYDGCALIVCNGQILAQGSQFSTADVEVITAVVNLDNVRAYRAASSSRMDQSSRARLELPLAKADSFALSNLGSTYVTEPPSKPQPLRLHTPEEECAYGPACWLWDYLRRSGAAGFFLPLSGGADSSATATIVSVMCHLVVEAAKAGDPEVSRDLKRLMQQTAKASKPDSNASNDSSNSDSGSSSACGGLVRVGDLQDAAQHALTDKDKDSTISKQQIPTAEELTHVLLHTAYMGTENSGAATQKRASLLAEQLGAHHSYLNIDGAVAAVVAVFRAFCGKTPRFGSRGGTPAEDLALQNIQVYTYTLCIQLCMC